MNKYWIFAVVLFLAVLKAEYIVGDHVSDIQFIDTNIDSTGTVIYENRSIKDIISSGRVIAISFFGVG